MEPKNKLFLKPVSFLAVIIILFLGYMHFFYSKVEKRNDGTVLKVQNSEKGNIDSDKINLNNIIKEVNPKKDDTNVKAKADKNSTSDNKNSILDKNLNKVSVTLNDTQFQSLKIEPVNKFHFTFEKSALGIVAYSQKDIANKNSPQNNASLSDSPIQKNKFIIANVTEQDSPYIKIQQNVRVSLEAYPNKIFQGKVVQLGGTVWDVNGNPALDPVTRTIAVRCEIADLKNEFYPGMFATIYFEVKKPQDLIAIPENALVWKADGNYSTWVTTDRKKFEERVVKIGIQQEGYIQILEGLKLGDLVVTDGAVFVSNSYYAPQDD